MIERAPLSGDQVRSGQVWLLAAAVCGDSARAQRQGCVRWFVIGLAATAEFPAFRMGVRALLFIPWLCEVGRQRRCLVAAHASEPVELEHLWAVGAHAYVRMRNASGLGSDTGFDPHEVWSGTGRKDHDLTNLNLRPHAAVLSRSTLVHSVRVRYPAKV